MTLIQEAAKRVVHENAVLKEVSPDEQKTSSLPAINNQDKGKILRELGLRKINKIRNVQALLQSMRQE